MRKNLVLSLFIALACASEPAGPPLETDAQAFGVTDLAEYVLPDSANEKVSIRWVYSNRTSDTVWIVGCGPSTHLQKLVEGEWIRANDFAEAGCMTAHAIAPGGQLRAERAIGVHHVQSDPIAGTYRLMWPEIVWNFENRTSTSLFGDLLPTEWRISNRFNLRE